MSAMVTVKCKNTNCKKEFQARIADRKRGWGKFCSKSCKAQKQAKGYGFTRKGHFQLDVMLGHIEDPDAYRTGTVGSGNYDPMEHK